MWKALIVVALSITLPLIVSAAQNHSNNWAVIVSTSRFWYNYRHQANALAIYRTVKRLGIPDSQIILMLPDDVSCNPRNKFPSKVFHGDDESNLIQLYDDAIQVDYRGTDVTVATFIQVLTGRHGDNVPASKRLATDEGSNILIYLNGHGGDGFLKFQDTEEIDTHDLGHAFEEMHVKGRYKEILLMIDTCHAASLNTGLYSPNILAIGSSAADEHSYATWNDGYVGLPLADRFTYETLKFFESNDVGKRGDKDSVPISKLFNHYKHDALHSTATPRTDLYKRRLDQVPLTDFFGSVLDIQAMDSVYPITITPSSEQGSGNAVGVSISDAASSDTRDGSSAPPPKAAKARLAKLAKQSRRKQNVTASRKKMPLCMAGVVASIALFHLFASVSKVMEARGNSQGEDDEGFEFTFASNSDENKTYVIVRLDSLSIKNRSKLSTGFIQAIGNKVNNDVSSFMLAADYIIIVDETSGDGKKGEEMGVEVYSSEGVLLPFDDYSSNDDVLGSIALVENKDSVHVAVKQPVSEGGGRVDLALKLSCAVPTLMSMDQPFFLKKKDRGETDGVYASMSFDCLFTAKLFSHYRNRVLWKKL